MYHYKLLNSLGQNQCHNVTIKAGQSITLNPGFTVNSNASLSLVTGFNAVSVKASSREYAAGIEYLNGQVEAIYFPDGRVYRNGGTWRYEYVLTDHLGNNRLSFYANGSSAAEIQQTHYYPFGMEMEGVSTVNAANKYKYNGKELNEDFGLNWYDYGARWYDPSIGRWGQVDPLAEKFVFASPNNFSFNNPLKFLDLDGREPNDIILKGNKDTQAELLTNLQALTNDRLEMTETGDVYIAKSNAANAGKDLEEGSALVKSLIEDDNQINIQKVDLGNGTNPVDNNSKTIKTPQQGIEYDSQVSVTLTPSNTMNENGTKGGTPSFISLGHELKHAKDLAEGKFTYEKFKMTLDFDRNPLKTSIITNDFTVREYNTRVFENKLRKEHNLESRILPIVFIK